MNLEQKALHTGAVAIALAVLLRLLSTGVAGQLTQALVQPEAVAAVLFLETGRVVRPQGTTASPATDPTNEPPPTQPIHEEQTPSPAVFSAGDAALVSVNSSCSYDADPKALLAKPLSWDLTRDGPAVLIVHTHGTESYQNTEDYEETSQYRTTDTGYNVVSVGQRLKEVLEAGGVQVLHDTAMHDHPSYTGSYNNSRKSIQKYLQEYPSIRMVLDIHRDSVAGADGKQKRYTVESGTETAAQVMLVVGTDANGLTHPNWQENLSLAVKLHAQLEKTTPGICRDISFRAQRFNQDLTQGSLLLEMGSAGNTRQEALLAADLVGQAILALAHGSAEGLV